MKALGIHAAHTSMRLALQLLIGESVILIQIPCTDVRGTRKQEFGVTCGLMEQVVMVQLQELLSSLPSAPTTQTRPDFAFQARRPLATSICVTAPSFEVPLLGLTNSAATPYSCDRKDTQGGRHDLYTLSGLYGKRLLHRPHGERRKYVGGGLALPQLRKRP